MNILFRPDASHDPAPPSIDMSPLASVMLLLSCMLMLNQIQTEHETSIYQGYTCGVLDNNVIKIDS